MSVGLVWAASSFERGYPKVNSGAPVVWVLPWLQEERWIAGPINLAGPGLAHVWSLSSNWLPWFMYIHTTLAFTVPIPVQDSWINQGRHTWACPFCMASYGCIHCLVQVFRLDAAYENIVWVPFWFASFATLTYLTNFDHLNIGFYALFHR